MDSRPYRVKDHDIISAVLDLFEKFCNRPILVRLIGVKFRHLLEGSHQINLFHDHTKYLNLNSAIDKMREHFGDRLLIIAAEMEARPIGRWNPFSSESPPLLPIRKF